MLTAYLDVPAIFFPAWFVRWLVLQPLAKAAKGTVDGVCLALRHGFAINLMGGFTHCTTTYGDLFNVYPDVTLAIHYAKKWHASQCMRILVINTSVMQANGVARELPNDESVYLCDIYDNTIAPKDYKAISKINQSATVGEFDNDESYISKITHRVNTALSSHNPDFVIYIAGYDCMSGDKKGKMNISESVVIFRDELIFSMIKEGLDTPVLMLIGGTHQDRQEATISRSIRNLVVKFDLSKKPLNISASENIKMKYKASQKAGYRMTGMRGGDNFGAYSRNETDDGQFSRRSFTNLNSNGGRPNQVGADMYSDYSGHIGSARLSGDYESNPMVSRLTTNLINKNEIGKTDNFSYKA